MSWFEVEVEFLVEADSVDKAIAEVRGTISRGGYSEARARSHKEYYSGPKFEVRAVFPAKEGEQVKK